MTNQERLITARLGILALATELKNVTKACRLVGMSRAQFYALKKTYESAGQTGLAPKIRKKPQMPNRTSAHIEGQILLKTQINPMVSYLRLARNMKLDGIAVTPTMIRYVWQRHGLSTRPDRLRWAKKHGDYGVDAKPSEDNKTASRLHSVAPFRPVDPSPDVPVSGSVEGAYLSHS